MKSIAIFLVFSMTGVWSFAANQKPSFRCDVGLSVVDKSSSFGKREVFPSRVEVIRSGVTPKGNKIYALRYSFKEQRMFVHVSIVSSDVKEPEYFWSSLYATLHQEDAGKPKVLGSVVIPESRGDAAVGEVFLMNSAFVEKVIQVPEFLQGTADPKKVSGASTDGDVESAYIACERTGP